MSDQGLAAVPDQQSVSWGTTSSQLQKNTLTSRCRVSALLEAFMILGPDVTPHRYGPLLPSNQQHLPPPDLISTDAAPPTPQPEMKYKVPKRTAVSRHFQVSK